MSRIICYRDRDRDRRWAVPCEDIDHSVAQSLPREASLSRTVKIGACSHDDIQTLVLHYRDRLVAALHGTIFHNMKRPV